MIINQINKNGIGNKNIINFFAILDSTLFLSYFYINFVLIYINMNASKNFVKVYCKQSSRSKFTQ